VPFCFKVTVVRDFFTSDFFPNWLPLAPAFKSTTICFVLTEIFEEEQGPAVSGFDLILSLSWFKIFCCFHERGSFFVLNIYFL
jgi:hypothetical protein